jgi:hypothetical protein
VNSPAVLAGMRPGDMRDSKHARRGESTAALGLHGAILR